MGTWAENAYARDHAALVAVERFTAEHGYPPTFREIAAAAGLSSVSVVGTALLSLERQGYVELPSKGRTRSIVIRRPSHDMPLPPLAKPTLLELLESAYPYVKTADRNGNEQAGPLRDAIKAALLAAGIEI